MHLDFRLLPMMDLRNAPGKVLDRVARRQEAFIVERNGLQLACLVPVSFVMPDVQRDRVAKELEQLEEAAERYKTRITAGKELELLFPREGASEEITLTVRLPHGYPGASPRVFAAPLEEDCPERWHDGSLCIFGAMELWNPDKHDASHALALARKWLARYETWRSDRNAAAGGGAG